MRISDWSSDVALPISSTGARLTVEITRMALRERGRDKPARARMAEPDADVDDGPGLRTRIAATGIAVTDLQPTGPDRLEQAGRSEKHTSELQSLMRIS